MSDLSSTDEDDKVQELQKIHKYVENQKAIGNRMFVSGWDDDTEGIDPSRNPINEEEIEFLEAAEYGDLDTVKKLLEKNVGLLKSRDLDGYTPLHRACYSNRPEMVEYLLVAGADPMALTEDKWTPLHSATFWNHVYCAIKMIEGGADVNAQTEGGQTPLHLASEHGAGKECLEMLLMHPLIKPNLTNKAGDAPYDIARRSGPYHLLFEPFEPSFQFIPTENIDEPTNSQK